MNWTPYVAAAVAGAALVALQCAVGAIAPNSPAVVVLFGPAVGLLLAGAVGWVVAHAKWGEFAVVAGIANSAAVVCLLYGVGVLGW